MAHSNIEFASLELQCFWGVSKNNHDKLRATFDWRWCCRCPRMPQLCSVDQESRWFETIVAFARLCLCGIETAIAFAGEKWAFLVQFVGAEVIAVSAVPFWGCAEVLLVSTPPCFCVLYAKYFALLGLMWARARKSSPCKPNMGEKCSFSACRASFFAELPLEGPRWANFVAPRAWQLGPSTGILDPSMRC